MRTIPLLSAALTSMLVALLSAIPAQADLHTYVASHGSGVVCSMAAPCNNFGTAVDATDPRGQITCLDNVNLPGGPINKSVTIDCAGTSSVSGPFIISGAEVVVLIRNLTINSGIAFLQGAALVVENCIITAAGIQFVPTTAGSLSVSNTLFINNGSGLAGGAIIIRPQAGGNVAVALHRVTVANNLFGIVADGAGGPADINMTIADSTVHGNSQDGIVATNPAGGASIGVTVKNTRSLNNNLGIRSTGRQVTVRLDGATVTGNRIGLEFNARGALLSAGNNLVEGNGKNGTFSGRVALK